MNNSQAKTVEISVEKPTSRLEEREILLVRLIEAIERIDRDWHFLHETILPNPESVEKKILDEAKKGEIVSSELYRLQGQLASAKKYDLRSLAEAYRAELSNIKKQKNANHATE